MIYMADAIAGMHGTTTALMLGGNDPQNEAFCHNAGGYHT